MSFSKSYRSRLNLSLKNVTCLAVLFVEVFVTDRLRLNFAEAVKVQLTRKRTELVMVEVLGDDIGRKYFRIFDNKHFPVSGSGTNFRITCFDHTVGLRMQSLFFSATADSFTVAPSASFVGGRRYFIRPRLADRRCCSFSFSSAVMLSVSSPPRCSMAGVAIQFAPALPTVVRISRFLHEKTSLFLHLLFSWTLFIDLPRRICHPRRRRV